MTFLPRDRYQRILLLVFALFFALSCIGTKYREFLLMQHVPTAVITLLLAWVVSRYPISRLGFTSIMLFLTLHTIGARYLYSYTPYDAWSEKWIGINLTEYFGFTRNHYDRLVHFSYGLLLVLPIREFERRHLGLSKLSSSLLAVEGILASSAAYELLEWLVAITFTPMWADTFLGQQGDAFDAHKDMALATLGALIAIGIATCVSCCTDRADAADF